MYALRINLRNSRYSDLFLAGKSKSVSSTTAPVPAAAPAAAAAPAVQVKKKTSAAARKAEINRKGNEKVRLKSDK